MINQGSRDNMSVIVVCFKGAPRDTADARVRDTAVNVIIENKVAGLEPHSVL